MKQVHGKYRTLQPSNEYLFDEVIIAQAWKKTHGYIRNVNWYADTLELDVSALGIEENASEWAKQLENSKPLDLVELVPAVKSEAWVLDSKGWHPKDIESRKDKVPLRPLAHISIRDQTWATSAMLCLADAVESAQGNCSRNEYSFDEARKKGVYSYGNRLICDWKKDDRAWFRWGNSETYRKFFTDYQSFLKRPLELGRQVEENCDNEDVYIVNLDLAKFYNTIDIKVLISRLKAISKDFGHHECNEFWEAIKEITSWQWSPEHIELAKELKLGDIESGLPQGLVASGFLANAYLVEFDREVGNKLGNQLKAGSQIKVHDYCRYVDDLRLVISVDSSSTVDITKEVNSFVSKCLTQYGGKGLKVNPDKTKVTLLSDLDNKGGMSNRIEMIQSDLSGPADRELLEATGGILESFLSIEEDVVPKIKSTHMDANLLSISNFDHDIRPDTLKRFAANRLEGIVRSKRALNGIGGGPKVFDHHTEGENELLAKKLIAAWFKDPSLALVLRKAIEIYPDADLFEPVITAIFIRSKASGSTESKKDAVTARLMDYLLADLFRCAVDFNGYFQVIPYPADINPKGVIELITRAAQKVIRKNDVSTYVSRQALMLLAVTNKPAYLTDADGSSQLILHRILSNDSPEYKTKYAALYEVAGQITGHEDTYAALFLDNIEEAGVDKYDALEPFAKRGGGFWFALWKQLKKNKRNKELQADLKWAEPHVLGSPKMREQSLSKIIASKVNGFEYEHALIKLAMALIAAIEKDDKGMLLIGCAPSNIRIKAENVNSWRELWLSDAKISCVVKPQGKIKDPRYEIPRWVSASNELNIIYWVGTILRTAVLGGSDFTGNRWRKSDLVTYKGLRTSWYKRRMGMMHSPENLVGECSTVSSWFSSLLMRCLQWPGFESTYVVHDDIRKIDGIETLRKCLSERLNKLNGLICTSSRMPILPTNATRPKNSDVFRIVTVQALIPKSEDFSVSDIGLDNPAIRKRHVEHLRDICSLTQKTLETKLKADGGNQSVSADLIVFPEVSVHVDDQYVLKRLADKTKSIVFAGLVFKNEEGKYINVARWFIPDYRDSGRQWVIRDQGKKHMTANEIKLGISSHRPCQHVIEIGNGTVEPFRITGAICYDATDIKLAADLKDKSDLFVVCAHNRDVNTFDNMASALQYHMYQHVVICNIGEFGGSTIQAPFKEPYHRLISHVHGVGQVSINTADLDLDAFRREVKSYKEVKAKPAGDA